MLGQNRHEAVPARRPPKGSLVRPDARNPDGYARLLLRRWQKLRLGDFVALPIEVEWLARPQPCENCQPFVQHFGAPLEVGFLAKRLPLQLTAACAAQPRAEDQPPAR